MAFIKSASLDKQTLEITSKSPGGSATNTFISHYPILKMTLIIEKLQILGSEMTLPGCES